MTTVCYLRMFYYESVATFRSWSQNELQTSALHTHNSDLSSLYRFRSEELCVLLSVASTSAGTCPRFLALPQQNKGFQCPALPHACTVTQQLECWCNCWCRPSVQAHCEELGWLFCKAFDNRLWFYVSPAVTCVCCCQFGLSDCELYWFAQKNSLDLSFCLQHSSGTVQVYH